MSCVSNIQALHVDVSHPRITYHIWRHAAHPYTRFKFGLPVHDILIGRKATKRSQLSSPMIYTPIEGSPTYCFMRKRRRYGPDHLVKVCAMLYHKWSTSTPR